MIVAAIAVVALIFGIAWAKNGVTGDRESITQEIGANVAATGDKKPKNLKAKVTNSPTPFPVSPGIVSLGQVVEVTPHGKLSAPLKLRFKLTQPAPEGTTVFVAHKREGEAEWSYSQAELSQDRQFATTTTDHLSWWWPFSINPKEVLGGILKEVVGTVTSDMTANADQPKCDQEKTAREDGYDIQSKGVALYWCFGKADGKRMVKIVNKMRYPLDIKYSGFKPIDTGKLQVNFANLARLGSGKDTVLYPFDTAIYGVELDAGKFASINSAFSGYAQSLYRFDVAFQALLAIVGKFNIVGKYKGWESYWDELNNLAGNANCLNGLAKGDYGDIMLNCFDSGTLGRLFGGAAVLLSPFMVVGALFNWLRSEFNSVGDMLNGRDRYTVTVKRTDSFAKFVGEWHVHGAKLVVKSNMTGELSWNEGPCNFDKMCTGYAGLKFSGLNGDRVVATVTSIRVIDTDGKTPFDIGRTGEMYGETFTFTYLEPGLLRRTASDPDWQSGNPYFCGDGVNPSKVRLCG